MSPAVDDRIDTARVIVDLDAITHNVRLLAGRACGAQVMAVVKGDAYGHGRAGVARAALAGGATWLGAAQLTEALALRAELGPVLDDGTPLRILSWLHAPGARYDDALAADLDLTVSGADALDAVAAAAQRRGGQPARVHLKVDTGMARLGANPGEVADLAARAAAARDRGLVDVVGVWSHLACADAPQDPTTSRQDALLREAAGIVRAAGFSPTVHLAASAGILWHPDTHHDLVRAGIAMYGVSPNPQVATAADLGLRPALRWEADLALVRRVPGATPVSYGATETTPGPRWLGVVPVGYADGVPRHASGTGPIRVGDVHARIVGRVCMDQVIVDLGPARDGAPAPARAGDTAVLIGPDGPSADDWARAADTIGYEIVTRIGCRVPRRHVHTTERPGGDQ